MLLELELLLLLLLRDRVRFLAPSCGGFAHTRSADSGEIFAGLNGGIRKGICDFNYFDLSNNIYNKTMNIINN